MRKNIRLVGLFIFTMIILMLFGCHQKKPDIVYQPDDLDKMIYDVSEDQYFDQEGNLMVTYDVAYKQLFESGQIKYEEDAILIKVSALFDGVLTKNMKNAGLESLAPTHNNGRTSWFKATIKPTQNVKTVIQNLRDLSEILVADYDYIYETESISTPEVLDNSRIQEQWSLSTYGVETAWSWLKDHSYDPGGSSSVVVAVIDTGVDYNHPDLKNNMWINAREIPGNNIDDDDNGYIDDIHGIDTIAKTSNPMDDHGHGTHVAGIIAADNNNQGIVGIAYNSKIMAVKAGMASGYFTQSSIAEAIYYAYENGADIINMSFGGSAISIAVQDALMTAYTRSILVASAGNSGFPNEPIEGWFGPVVPNYPAALSYVVGVMSVNQSGVESSFSNWDARAFNQIEYEVYAPGEQILSTLPNDSYASWSGTSMSAPFVSGVAALLRSVYSDREVYTNKFIMGQLVSTAQRSATGNIANPMHNIPYIIDPLSAVSELPKPDINLYDYYFYDSTTISEMNNGDGRIDAGETVDMGIVLRNRWGMSENTTINIQSISTGGVENPYVEFITSTISMDSIGTYSTKDNLSRNDTEVTGVATPLRFKVLQNTPNDYIINLTVIGTYENALDQNDETIYRFETVVSFKVRKGYILPNIISADTTLTKDNYYIIPNSMVVMAGATLRVEPGTNIQFWTNDPMDAYAQTSIVYLKVEGKLIIEGSIDEPVKLFPSQLMDRFRVEIYESGQGYVSIAHAEIANAHINVSRVEYSKFTKNHLQALNYRYLESGKVREAYWETQRIQADHVSHSVFYGMSISQDLYYYQPEMIGYFENNMFVNSSVRLNGQFEDNVFLGNNGSIYGSNVPTSSTLIELSKPTFDQIIRNPETGTTYMYLKGTYLSRNGFARLASYFGGHLAMFETESEYNYVLNRMSNYDTQYNNYVIGAYVSDGQFYWDDGSMVGSYMPTVLNKEAGIVGIKYYNNVKNLYMIDGYHYYGALIEIPGDIYINQIALSDYETSIDLDSMYQITPTLNPSTALVSNLHYISSDTDVITVDNKGLVTPKSTGSATVYVYSSDFQVSNEVQIHVIEKVALTSLNIVDVSQLSVGDTVKLQTVLTPSNTTQRFLQYTSLNPDIISINASGMMTGLRVGTGTITVSSLDGLFTDQIIIQVVNPVEKIQFKESIYVTSLTQIDDDFLPVITPFDATNQNIIWESSNPDVAYVENNQLIKLKEGTTTILASIENTTLTAEIVVSVNSTYQSNKVIKMSQYSNFYFALLEDGSMYYWGRTILAPKKWNLPVSQPIKDFSNIYNSLFVLLLDGTVKTFEFDHSDISYIYTYSYQYDTSSLSNISKLFGQYNSAYALDQNGAVWAWGNNEHGQLGDGTKIQRSTPVQSQITDVTDIAVVSTMVAFHTSADEVFIAGGYQSQYTTPLQIETDVNHISHGGDEYVLVTKDVAQYVYQNTGMYHTQVDSIYTKFLSSPTTKVTVDQGEVYIQGDNMYGRLGVGVTSSYIHTPTKMAKITDADQVFIFGSNIFVQTTTGEFYGSGLNSGYQLGNLSNNNSSIPVQIFFGLKGNEGGTIIEDDNFENLTLTSDHIFLDFNEALMQSTQYGYVTLKNSANQQLSVLKSLHLDKFSIKPYAGWIVGETYTLTIPTDAFTSKFMISNTYVDYTFTYLGEQTAIEFEGASILEAHKFDIQDIQFDLNFTYAEVGIAYDGIQLINTVTNEVVSIEQSLIDGVLTFSGYLPYGQYQLTVPAGALKDNLGGTNAEILLHFEVLQTIKLLSTSHEDQSIRKPVNQAIVLTYNVALEGPNYNQIQLLDDQGVEVSVVKSLIDHTLTLEPTSDLQMGKDYIIIIPEGALVDALGNVNALINHHFDTYTPIEFIRSSIANNTTNVNPNQLFNLFFNYSEPSNLFDEITIKDSLGNVVKSVVTLRDTDVVIQPEQALPQGTYQLFIPSGALKDEMGVENELVSISFTTIQKTTRFMWQTDNLSAKWREFTDKGLYSNFYGNAILNNFNNTDVETWLRIQAPTSTTYNNITGVGGNYWGTINPVMVERQILDFDDFQSLLDIVTGEYLITAPEQTFPFVTQIQVFDQNGELTTKVGNELITVKVYFNRDMDTTVDLVVKFGSSLPYAERQIIGSYITPRIWEGTYQLTTIIENGNQFFSVSNGVAVNNDYYKLQPDVARFRFEIDTTEAQALVMQAEASAQGIQLTWEQDDFDTLAGYNIYRSTDEFGYYRRLNQSIIPYDIKTYFDDSVEPGVVYYYNFTVVNTDLSESEPSGKVQVQSFDTMAPNIYHTPITQGFTNNNLIVSATIVDNLRISSAKVYYRTTGQTDWLVSSMSNRNDKYTAIIQSEYITVEGLEYYIEVYDGINYSYKGSSTTPYTIMIQEAIDMSKMGDVNDDGVISTLDALMVLQTMNGRLNLTLDEFTRADLDKDNVLEAWEVLRILQYVSGKVKTIIE